MKKAYLQNLRDQQLRDSLPLVVLRPYAARLAGCTTTTLRRHELAGDLKRIVRNKRVIGYDRDEFLAWLFSK